jgi:nicotinamide-nucleotide amidase
MQLPPLHTTAILNIGTELTRGELVNTNATWMAARLTAMGFSVVDIDVIADDSATIVATLQRLAGAHRVVIVSGGLGPTTDDLTSACAAEAFGAPLVRDAASMDAIARRFASFGREMTPSNAKQADFPERAEILANPIGTAPGFTIRSGECELFFTPGVPAEMRRMLDEQIVPRIAHLAPNDAVQIHLKCFGQGESKIGEMLAGVEAAHPGVTIGYRVHFPEIEVKVFAKAGNRAEAQLLADGATRDVRQRLGELVYAEGASETFAGTIARTLRSLGVTLAIAESCTGGLVGHMLTAVPGTSEFLFLDAVVYANHAKTAVLGVDPELLRAYGAVSSECAVAMAEGVRRVAGSDVAVSITGVAGPGGGSDSKPVGLVFIGVASSRGASVQELRFGGDRTRVQQLAAYAALKAVVDEARALLALRGRLDAAFGG